MGPVTDENEKTVHHFQVRYMGWCVKISKAKKDLVFYLETEDIYYAI